MTSATGHPRVVYFCDWLPPDFGAVGQYSIGFATERAERGEDVTLVGLSSTADSIESRAVGGGWLTVRKLKSSPVARTNLAKRLVWTLRTNGRLLARAWREIRAADEIVFTGSPPFLLHFLAPLNLLLRKRLTYRITDFHPECLIAGLGRVSLPLRLLYALTVAWRKTIHRFEVLGEDQRRRLLEIGIRPERMLLKRDPSPVTIRADAVALPTPPELEGRAVLLYSGNFGQAHDHETFLVGYRDHHRQGTGRVGLWLNATGAGADELEQRLRDEDLPVCRSRPLPLAALPRLLVTPAAHLITLKPPYVGYVMPSKVYGCIESGRDVLFVGSEESDVHLLCRERLPAKAYHFAPAGSSGEVAARLEAIAERTLPELGELEPAGSLRLSQGAVGVSAGRPQRVDRPSSATSRRDAPAPEDGLPVRGDQPCLDGLVWILRHDGRWSDLPADLPPASACWQQLIEWEVAGTLAERWRGVLGASSARELAEWEQVFAALEGSLEWEIKGSAAWALVPRPWWSPLAVELRKRRATRTVRRPR